MNVNIDKKKLKIKLSVQGFKSIHSAFIQSNSNSYNKNLYHYIMHINSSFIKFLTHKYKTVQQEAYKVHSIMGNEYAGRQR